MRRYGKAVRLCVRGNRYLRYDGSLAMERGRRGKGLID